MRKQGQHDDVIFVKKLVTTCVAVAAGESQHLAARDWILDIMMLGTVDDEDRKEEHTEHLSLSSSL